MRNIVFVVALLMVPLALNAQLLPDASNVAIELAQQFAGPTKTFPGPLETYRAEVRGTSVDLNRSTITWTHNGKVVARGLGIRTYTFTTGAAGTRDALTAAVVAPDGTRHSPTKTLAINDVDLLWFTETTVPVWYDGKPLPSVRSTVRVAAFPQVVRNGAPIPASQLIYRWSQKGQIVREASGAGRDLYTFTTDFVTSAEAEISVTVSDINQTAGAQKTVVVLSARPLLRFYSEHPLEGVLSNRALSRFPIPSDSTQSFRVAPFFFSKSTPLSYEWFVNDARADAGGAPDLLQIAAARGVAASASISATVKNLKNILEEARGAFTVDVQ